MCQCVDPGYPARTVTSAIRKPIGADAVRTRIASARLLGRSGSEIATVSMGVVCNRRRELRERNCR
jgi:hypothetical protein